MLIAIYISEIVHPTIRGSLLVLPNFFVAFGSLFTWLVAYFFSWSMTAYISTITPTLTAILMVFLPESPYWLIQANQPDAAK